MGTWTWKLKAKSASKAVRKFFFFFQVSLKVDFQVDSEVDLAAARRVIQSITSSSFINSIQFNLESAVTIESTTAIPIPICYQFSNYSIEVNCWLLNWIGLASIKSNLRATVTCHLGVFLSAPLAHRTGPSPFVYPPAFSSEPGHQRRHPANHG